MLPKLNGDFCKFRIQNFSVILMLTGADSRPVLNIDLSLKSCPLHVIEGRWIGHKDLVRITLDYGKEGGTDPLDCHSSVSV